MREVKRKVDYEYNIIGHSEKKITLINDNNKLHRGEGSKNGLVLILACYQI